jgi:hypothetical protein
MLSRLAMIAILSSIRYNPGKLTEESIRGKLLNTGRTRLGEAEINRCHDTPTRRQLTSSPAKPEF